MSSDPLEPWTSSSCPSASVMPNRSNASPEITRPPARMSAVMKVRVGEEELPRRAPPERPARGAHRGLGIATAARADALKTWKARLRPRVAGPVRTRRPSAVTASCRPLAAERIAKRFPGSRRSAHSARLPGEPVRPTAPSDVTLMRAGDPSYSMYVPSPVGFA